MGLIRRIVRKELWLEFGEKQGDGWQNMHWYNEGRWQEFPYWFKDLLKRLFLRQPKYKMYYTIRYGKKGFTVVL